MEKERIRVTDYLSNVPLFSELDSDEIESLAGGTTLVQLARKEVLFRRGEPCVGFHIVVYGDIKLSFVSASGEERVAQLVSAGDTFGEALMFAEAPYIVTAEAISDTLLLHVARRALMPTVERDRAFARKMLGCLSTRLRDAMADLEAFGLRSAPQRVIDYLLALRGEPIDAGRRVKLNADKRVIASRLNMTPEYFSRIMQDFSSRGLLTMRGREVLISDPARLRVADTH